MKFNFFNKKKIEELSDLVVDKEVLQQACKHPLWFEYSQEYTEDEVTKEVKCVVCDYSKIALSDEFDYRLNHETGLYDTNIININELSHSSDIDDEVIFKIVKAEYEKFARNYERDLINKNISNIGEETVKEFKKRFRR